MRVAIVTETFLPKVDGIVRMLTELLDYLSRTGHDALVLTPGAGPDHYAGFPVERCKGLRWQIYPGLSLARPTPRMLTTLRRWQPDIVHLAGPVLLGAQAAMIGRLLGLPLAAHFQTDLAAYAGYQGLGWLAPATWRYLRGVHALADRTYCPTPTVRQQLVTHGFRRLALCSRGVDTVRFQPRWRDAALRLRVLGPDTDPGTPILVHVGRLSPEKNLSALVTVARARPDLPLLIVGDGPARPALERALAGTRAYLTGELRGAALAAAYASGDLFLCPSQTETFCQVAQEAFASGLPVVGFRAGGVRDVVTHGATGLLCAPENDQDWLAAIDALIDDPARRASYGQQARAVAEQRSWTAVFDQLLHDYQGLATTRRRPAPFVWPGRRFGSARLS